jgi:hypothetical protein
MTIARAINFIVFLIACAALTATYFAWMAGELGNQFAGVCASASVTVMLATIIFEWPHSFESKRRGFEVSTDRARSDAIDVRRIRNRPLPVSSAA